MFDPMYEHPSPCSYPYGDCECEVEDTTDPRVAGAMDLAMLADPVRADRADEVRVIRATEKRDRPLLDATVASVKDDSRTYRVRLLLAVDGERGRFWCSCPDHSKRTNVCKHIVAVANRYVAARIG